MQRSLLLSPVVTEAKATLSNLFKGQNRDLWFSCYPSEVAAHLHSPPSSGKNFVAELLGNRPAAMKAFVLPAIEELNKAIEEPFVGPATSTLVTGKAGNVITGKARPVGFSP